jgi:HAD superfamily hydrolase (TIGR01549 family)
MINAIIFDMDGTITKPRIDWKTLRERIGAPPDRTIIDHIASLEATAAERASRILMETEMEACLHSELNDGVCEMLVYLREQRIRTALVTNNHSEAVQVVLKRHGLVFDVVLSRKDGAIKPSVDLIQKALSILSLRSDEVLSIGDGRYDLEASQEAGIPFLYVTNGRPSLDYRPAVPSLIEALAWVKSRI